MKIPETSANVGAYYGNEDNGQWQPNGVIIDSGVGGGVVGSGDAGVHRPVYPVHIPRGHIPAGYVMAGAFYPPAAYPVQPQPDDFEDYMWMENEEEFDKQVMQQLEEEALMEQCIEAMLEDEQRERRQPTTNGHGQPTTSSSNPLSLEETVSRSTLNPLAAEFVPTAGPAPPVVPLTPAAPEAIATAENRTETTTEPPAAPPAEPAEAAEPKADVTEPPTPEETPEVSAADIAPIDKRPKDNTKKDVKPKPEAKKQSKVDSKVKFKPQVVKSEPKVTQPRKKELVKAKSEVKVEEKVDEVAVGEAAKPQPVTPLEEPATPGFKPINYAAAARANKPKKPTTPPVEIPTATPTLKSDKDRKLEKRTEKPTLKTEKVAQRKNSAK